MHEQALHYARRLLELEPWLEGTTAIFATRAHAERHFETRMRLLCGSGLPLDV